jgi:hypothetical protein
MKRIEELLQQALHNLWLKVIALVLAGLTWFYIVGQFTKR